MGGSSPPFLYGRRTNDNFDGPAGRPFDPKAVTRASWTRPPSKPEQNGPYVNLNQHPDSYYKFPNKSQYTPMSPHTKRRVIYGRMILLGLRVLALLGGLGSLFCAIVIKNIAVTILWIIRAGPIVAVLHTLYGIYHLCRSPVTRAPGSQASYMIFGTTLDLGLIPYYVFSAYIAHQQITDTSDHWGTLFSANTEVINDIAKMTFLLSIINGSMHLISLGISIFLATIFRQIRRLPPDMNPLEDNLTARSHKRNKSELTEKHRSSSTINSTQLPFEDPMVGPPRNMSFMHTRARSSDGGSSRVSTEVINDKRRSQYTLPTNIPAVPPLFLHKQSYSTRDLTNQPPVRNIENIPHGAPVREPSPEIPTRSQCVSPESENWIVYPSRTPSPLDDANDAHLTRRDPSSVYRKNEPLPSTIAEDIREEYEPLALHEYYGNEDIHDFPRQDGLYGSADQDIGDHPINIFPDHDEHDEELTTSLQVNPLTLNPPTPRPILNETDINKSNTGRVALTDIPNLTPNPPASISPEDGPEKKSHFYGELEGKSWLTVPRGASGQSEPRSRGLGSLVRKMSKPKKSSKNQKLNAYGALKQHDDDESDDNDDHETPTADPVTINRDRKGRVVSNSGVDIGSSLSYGNYIANLGVGRRRDVSGKVAEEGRSGVALENERPSEDPKPVRAAGWARFAGL